jgi:membrane-associated protein
MRRVGIFRLVHHCVCRNRFSGLPFLPSDYLLFIAGAFGAIGRYIGPRVFPMDLRFLDRGALTRTHAFYEKHGGKTIVLSRFMPVVRIFAPFVAGVAHMSVGRFQLFNVMGALIWVISPIAAGYFFGNIPLIRDHLNTIVLLGLAAAVVPVVGGALFKLLHGNRKPA